MNFRFTFFFVCYLHSKYSQKEITLLKQHFKLNVLKQRK